MAGRAVLHREAPKGVILKADLRFGRRLGMEVFWIKYGIPSHPYFSTFKVTIDIYDQFARCTLTRFSEVPEKIRSMDSRVLKRLPISTKEDDVAALDVGGSYFCRECVRLQFLGSSNPLSGTDATIGKVFHDRVVFVECVFDRSFRDCFVERTLPEKMKRDVESFSKYLFKNLKRFDIDLRSL